MPLCIDIGGTAIKLGLVDEAGQIYARREVSVSFDSYRTPIIDTVILEAEDFLNREVMEVESIGGDVSS